MDNNNYDKVLKPEHYTLNKIETLDYIDDNLGENIEYYYIGNVIKYVSRYRHKGGVQDLQKAKFYLDRLIKKMSKEE